jgi:hypothetical protein
MPNPLFSPRIRVIDSSAEAAVPEAERGPPPVPDRTKGCRRPHHNKTVAAVRRLIEETTLTYKQIAAKTGTSPGTVGTWTRESGWHRPLFAPRASDLTPSRPARRRLNKRMLQARLQALAEHCVGALEGSESVDLDRLIEAMQVVKMARLEYRGNRRQRRAPGAPRRRRRRREAIDPDDAMRKALKDFRRGGVDVGRIPDEAIALLEDAHAR